MAVVKPGYREKVVTFGEKNGLVGIVCTPAEPNASLPGAILPNSGIIHRVGANRLYVHRGTGFYGFPLRIGVPGEASCLEVVLARQA